MLASFIFLEFFVTFVAFQFLFCRKACFWSFGFFNQESGTFYFFGACGWLFVFLGWIGSTKICDLDGLAALGRTEKEDDGGAARWRAAEFENEKIFLTRRREEDHKSKQTRRLWPASKASSRHWEIGRRSGVGNALQNKKSLSKGTRWGTSGVTDLRNSSSGSNFALFCNKL